MCSDKVAPYKLSFLTNCLMKKGGRGGGGGGGGGGREEVGEEGLFSATRFYMEYFDPQLYFCDFTLKSKDCDIYTLLQKAK